MRLGILSLAFLLGSGSMSTALAAPFSFLPQMKFGRSGLALTQLHDGRVLIGGGAFGDYGGELFAELFNPTKKTIVATAGNPSYPRSHHTQTLLADGRVLLAGGSADFEIATDQSEVFDPVTNTFKRVSNMLESRVGHGAVRLPNGTVLIVGGEDGYQYSTTMELFSPETGTFESYPLKLTVGRAGHTTSLVADRFLVIAGGEGILPDSGDGAPQFLSSVEVFDLKSEPHTHAMLSMAYPRLYHTAIPIGSGMLAFTGGIEAIKTFSSYVELLSLEPEMNIDVVGKLANARSLHETNPISETSFLVSGGVSDDGPLRTLEICKFNAIDKQIFCTEKKSQLTRTRWSHAALTLSNGSTLVVGGMSAEKDKGQRYGGPTRTIELVKP